jgi:hypothetical protein
MTFVLLNNLQQNIPGKNHAASKNNFTEGAGDKLPVLGYFIRGGGYSNML